MLDNLAPPYFPIPISFLLKPLKQKNSCLNKNKNKIACLNPLEKFQKFGRRCFPWLSRSSQDFRYQIAIKDDPKEPWTRTKITVRDESFNWFLNKLKFHNYKFKQLN